MSSAVVPSGMDPSNVHEEVLSPQLASLSTFHRPKSSVVSVFPDSAAQKFFRVPELVGIVAQFSQRPDLHPLLFVSRNGFEDVARILWRHLLSPAPLLNILDSVRWVQGQWRLVLPTSDYEKERFCLYAKFVRSFFSLLSSNPPGPLDIDANIFLHLELQGFSRPLFQLHSVVVPIVPSYYLPVLPPLLSPNLIDIRVFVPEGGAGCVSQILAESPEIKRLDLSGYILPEDLLFLPSLSCLEHLFINLCQDTTEVTTRRLLAALQALTLRDSVKALHCIIPFHIQVPVVSIARRGSITTLHLRATSTVALRNLSAIEQLVDVTLELSDSVVGSTDVYPCFEVLASTSKETLRSVTLISNGTAALSASIIPLLGIREMRSFSVRNTDIHHLDLDNRDMTRIVEAWPNLETLVLPINILPHLLFNAHTISIVSRLRCIKSLQMLIRDGIIQLPFNPFLMNKDSPSHLLMRHYFPSFVF